MAQTVILSDETVRNLIEAHASLAAWYYQLSAALRAAGAEVEAPTDDQRRAFVEQFAAHYPELASAAQSIETPRPYVPPPVVPAPAAVVENEGVEIKEPPKDLIAAPAPVPQPEPAPPPVAPAEPGQEADGTAPSSGGAAPAPPPMVDPSKVKYED